MIVTHLDGPQRPRPVAASGKDDPGNALTRLGCALERALWPGATHPLLPACELTALLAAPKPQLALDLRVPARCKSAVNFTCSRRLRRALIGQAMGESFS